MEEMMLKIKESNVIRGKSCVCTKCGGDYTVYFKKYKDLNYCNQMKIQKMKKLKMNNMKSKQDKNEKFKFGK